jgi:hypothetical protein
VAQVELDAAAGEGPGGLGGRAEVSGDAGAWEGG